MDKYQRQVAENIVFIQLKIRFKTKNTIIKRKKKHHLN